MIVVVVIIVVVAMVVVAKVVMTIMIIIILLLLRKIVVIIIVVTRMTLKGAFQDFSQSPHSAANLSPACTPEWPGCNPEACCLPLSESEESEMLT